MERLAKLLLLYIGLVIASFASGVARPAIAYYVKFDLNSSMLAATGLTSGFMLGRALASLFSGVLGESRPSFRWIAVGLGLGVSGGLLYVFIPSSRNALTVIVGMGVWGVMSGFVWPLVQVATSELGGYRSGTAMAVYFALGGVGTSLGNWYFGYSHLSYSELVRVSGIVFFASAVILAFGMRGVARRVNHGVKVAVRRALDPMILWVILSAFTIGFMSGVLSEYFYVYVKETYGLSRDSLGGLLLVAGIASILGGLTAGTLSDHVGVAKTLYSVMILSAASALAMGVQPQSVIVLYLAFIGAYTGVRASMPLTRNAAIAGEVGGSLVVGVSNTASNLGMMISPMIAGLLYEASTNYGGIPYLLSGILLVATIALYPLAVKSPSRRGERTS